MALNDDINELKAMVATVGIGQQVILKRIDKLAEQQKSTPAEAPASDTINPERKLTCLQEIFYVLDQGGRKIEAIRFCRELTGCALKEAKDLIEFLQFRYFPDKEAE